MTFANAVAIARFFRACWRISRDLDIPYKQVVEMETVRLQVLTEHMLGEKPNPGVRL